MIRQEEISIVIDAQQETFLKQEPGFLRDALPHIPIADSFANTDGYKAIIVASMSRIFLFSRLSSDR